MDTHARLRQLLRERGWTEYKLSKECGLAQSTIGNIFRRNTVPSLDTLETICNGFGITMSQFFADAEMVELTPDMKELFNCWVCLTPSQKDAALQMLKAMSHDNGWYECSDFNVADPAMESVSIKQSLSEFGKRLLFLYICIGLRQNAASSFYAWEIGVPFSLRVFHLREYTSFDYYISYRWFLQS